MAERRDVPALQVTIPPHWLTALRSLKRSGNVWIAALATLHWVHVTGRSTVWVSADEFVSFTGMSRHALHRALDRLQTAGLIRIDRAVGQMPRVTAFLSPPKRRA